jgi:hypothetical protein
MRKVIIVILVGAALCVYTWDVMLVMRSPKSGSAESGKEALETVSIDKFLASAGQVQFIDKKLDPFTPHHSTIRTAVPKAATTGTPAARVDAAMPKVTINGIMWNETAPLAMLTLPDGSSTVAKPGQSFGDITVKKIEKARICIVVGKKEFWINQ